MKIFVPNAAPWVRDMMMKSGHKMAKAALRGQGVGRHTREEIYSIAEKDLRGISNILGDKSYVMGEEPTVVDSTVFGAVAQALWQDVDSPPSKFLRTECTNLVSHAERMKERYWPDWEDAIALRRKYHHGK